MVFAVGIALVFLLFGSVEFTEVFARAHEHVNDTYRVFGADWRAFEVIGIPLPKPGFYVVELASPKLGGQCGHRHIM